MAESRTTKAILNAKYNLLFLIINVLISFFSRKIFLNCLGTQFLGLSSTLQSLLGFLNLAELGIGVAIGVSLYKPLADNDRKSVSEIVSVLGYYYRNVGLLILSVGVIISLFLPKMFESEDISLWVVYATYYAFLASTLFSYFINYRQTLLNSDQKNYVVTKYLQTANVVKLLAQMSMAYLWANVFVWILFELIFGFIGCIILNRRIDKTYPWLVCDIKTGKAVKSKYPNIKKYTRQLFIQKVAGFAADQISPLFIYSFVTLDMVACATNYTVLMSKLTMFSNSIFYSLDAATGNLIATKDRDTLVRVYKEMFATNFFFAAFFSYMLYFLTEPFLGLWLGERFVLGKAVLLPYLGTFFICQYTTATWQFLDGYGLFKDVWAAILEVVLYLLFAFVGGYFFGLPGILLATTISKILISGLWKPYFLFTQGFHSPLSIYILLILRHFAVYAAIVVICEPLRRWLTIESSSWASLILNGLILMTIFLVVASVVLYLTIPQFKPLRSRIAFVFKRRKSAN